MKTSEMFLKAKSDKNLRSVLIMDYLDSDNSRKKIMRLCIDQNNKYNTNTETIFIESYTDIRYEDYSGKSIIKDNTSNLKTCFHLSYYNSTNYINTFLKAIKKDSEVSFKVIAFNSNENYKKANFVSHQIYGIIDNNYYLLENYVGPDNLASPIQY